MINPNLPEQSSLGVVARIGTVASFLEILARPGFEIPTQRCGLENKTVAMDVLEQGLSLTGGPYQDWETKTQALMLKSNWGAHEKTTSGNTIAHYAALTLSANLLNQALSAAPENLNAKNRDGWTPFLFLANKCDSENGVGRSRLGDCKKSFVEFLRRPDLDLCQKLFGLDLDHLIIQKYRFHLDAETTNSLSTLLKNAHC